MLGTPGEGASLYRCLKKKKKKKETMRKVLFSPGQCAALLPFRVLVKYKFCRKVSVFQVVMKKKKAFIVQGRQH